MTLQKTIIVLMLVYSGYLQYRIWIGDSRDQLITENQHRLQDLQTEVKQKKLRNEALYAEVLDLRRGNEAIEERARNELGMIKQNETFFQVIK